MPIQGAGDLRIGRIRNIRKSRRRSLVCVLMLPSPESLRMVRGLWARQSSLGFTMHFRCLVHDANILSSDNLMRWSYMRVGTPMLVKDV